MNGRMNRAEVGARSPDLTRTNCLGSPPSFASGGAAGWRAAAFVIFYHFKRRGLWWGRSSWGANEDSVMGFNLHTQVGLLPDG